MKHISVHKLNSPDKQFIHRPFTKRPKVKFPQTRDFMKITFLVLLACLVALPAFAGGESGGGGNIYIRHFVQVAKETIGELKLRSDDKYSDMLEVALKKITEIDAIEIVDDLKDKNGNAIKDNNLYAYSWPGKIQLLEVVWLKWLADLDITRKYKADIIHEIFRTIKVEMDDDYRISLVELGLGILKEDQFNGIEHDLVALLRAGAESITGETDGSEGDFWWVHHSDDGSIRKGKNISSAMQAGIRTSKNLNLVRFMETCNKAAGWDNEGKCFIKGLEKMSLKAYVSPTMAKLIVKRMCTYTLMYADGGRCFKATVPLISDPLLQDITAGCSYLNGGESITNCYLSGLI